MELLQLPNEIITLIFSYLDLGSKINMYNTCIHFRSLLHKRNLHTRCVVTFVTNLGKKGMKNPYFSEYVQYITYLDVSGIQYIPRKELVTSLKKFTKVETLKVAYTNIIVTDLNEICSKKVNLTSLSINLNWERKERLFKEFSKFKDVLENIEHLHFVANTDPAFFSQVALHICYYAPALSELKLTADHYASNTWYCPFTPVSLTLPPNCYSIKRFSLHIQDAGWTCPPRLNTISIIHCLDVTECHFILLDHSDPTNKIIVSKDLFGVLGSKSCHYRLFEKSLYELYIWNQQSLYIWAARQTASDVATEIEDSLVKNMAFCVAQSCEHNATGKCESYSINTCTISHVENARHTTAEPLAKRVSFVKKCVIDTGEIFIVQPRRLSIFHNCSTDCKQSFEPLQVSLIYRGSLMQHVQYLSLNSIILEENFFKLLFLNCPKLETLNICNLKPVSFESYFIRALNSKSNNLKNLKICQRYLSWTKLFLGLAKCRNLQILSILDESNEIRDSLSKKAIDYLIYSCQSIFYVSFYCNVSATTIRQWRVHFKYLKKKFPILMVYCDRERDGINSLYKRNPYEDIFFDHLTLVK